MSNQTGLPPSNKAHDPGADDRKRKRTGLGCAVVLVLLAIGLVAAAAVIWGPSAFRLLSAQTGLAAESPELHAKVEAVAEQRQRELTQLTSYGWVDKQANVVHIPIDQAMVLVAKEGLPVGVTPVAAAPVSTTAPSGEAVDLANVSFKDNVLPIFDQHCSKCHGDEKSEEGLKLIRYRTVIGGSQNGPVVVPGDPDNSYLVEMVVSGKMPKEGDPLTPAEIDIIKAWIAAGALDN